MRPEPRRTPDQDNVPLRARSAYCASPPERAVLVENFLCGQQDPKALQTLLDGHIYLRLKRGFKLRPDYMLLAYSRIVYLYALCEYVLYSG
jgi:hypothetical protein